MAKTTTTAKQCIEETNRKNGTPKLGLPSNYVPGSLGIFYEMPFGQFIVGAPGSGKTTFCHGIQQFLRACGRRVFLVNLDPANENIPYECDLDVRDLISLDEVMSEHQLGPNGGLLYCMEAIELNFEWLQDRLRALYQDHPADSCYFVFDFPGQVELFINHDSVYKLLHRLEREMHFRLVAVHLADSSHCRDPLRYVSLATLTLQSMLRLECPQINLMSKFDLFKDPFKIDQDGSDGGLPLSFYADCENLGLLLESSSVGDRFGQKVANLTAVIAELIEDFGIVSFIPIAVEDKECMAFAMQEIDKANGHVFGALTAGNEAILQTAMTAYNRQEYLESMENKYCRDAGGKD